MSFIFLQGTKSTVLALKEKFVPILLQMLGIVLPLTTPNVLADRLSP